MNKLNKEQLDRYYHTIFLSDIKEEGQLKLLNSKVLVVGCGGLANNVIPLLAASGVGFISIVDNDRVRANNLPRQVFFEEKDIGQYKVSVMKKRISRQNRDVVVETHKVYLDKSNATRMIKGYDIVVDCTDNFETKFLINDTCLKLGIPFVIAGVSDYAGQVITCIPNQSRDFKSLFSELPINIEQHYKDEDQGVFPPAVGLIGNIACNEVLKYLLGIGELLLNALLVVDTRNWEIKKIKIPE